VARETHVSELLACFFYYILYGLFVCVYVCVCLYPVSLSSKNPFQDAQETFFSSKMRANSTTRIK